MFTGSAVGRFVRLTKWSGEKFPAPIWCVIVRVLSDGVVVGEIFHGIEIWKLSTTHRNPRNRLQITAPWDEFSVRTIDTLPQYALVAWTKHKLLKGID